ncbi:unnamed protein product [Lactuca virosa]|uniref:Ankyrin repeat-containing protein n=1 Tax=Lactuca virosa TaxID=75947 RepID=A0AAU9PLZ6_9ASTR|nr:unnamed protein product [Lactuca virosa]
MISKSKLHKAVMEGQWWEVETILRGETNEIGEVINNDGETVLHILVRTDGSTALHIAAITGNTDAAALLIKKMKSLMTVEDSYEHVPFVSAYMHKQLDASVFLVKGIHENLQTHKWSAGEHSIAFSLLLDIIFSRKYDLALGLLNAFPDMAAKDTVDLLMALARDFPGGLGCGEALVYLSFTDIRRRILKRTSWLLTPVQFCSSGALAEPVKDALSAIIRILIGETLMISGFT